MLCTMVPIVTGGVRRRIGAGRIQHVASHPHKGEFMARRFMAAAAVGAMLLVACGSDNKTSNSAAPASAAPASAAPADTTPAAVTTAAPADTSGSATTAAPTDTAAPDDSAGLVGDHPASAGPD